MTPLEYTHRVVKVSPGLLLALVLESAILYQWTGIPMSAHPVHFGAHFVTTVFYLDKMRINEE